MQSFIGYRFCRTTIVVALAFLMSFVFPVSLAPQTDKDRKWTEKNYYKILNDLLPMRGDSAVYVTYRASETLHLSNDQDPEDYFLLGIDFSPKGNALNRFVSAHVRTAESKSIFEQIMRLHHEDFSMDWQSIERKIKLKSLDYTEADCPVVGEEFRAFQELKYGPPYTKLDGLEVVLDPPSYEFHIAATYGHSDIELNNNSHPLVVWAMKTQREIEACALKPNK
jgi:hypothetical protein